MIQRNGLPAVIVNPSTPIGPRDVKPTPTGRIIVEAASGRMPAFVDTGLNLAMSTTSRPAISPRSNAGESASATFSAAQNVLLATCLPTSRALSGDDRRPSSCREPCSIRLPTERSCWRDRAASSRSSRRTACGCRATTCSSTIPRRGAELGYVSRPYARASPTRSPGFARTASSNDHVAVSLIPLAIWAYLLIGRGWFWLCGERDDFAAPRLSDQGGFGPASSRSSPPATKPT